MRLRSADPLETPEINFHSFQELSEGNQSTDADLEALLDGVKFVREIGKNAGAEEFHPGKDFQTDEQIRQWIRRDAWGHHACGTCRMGRSEDPEAVLDSQFRVLGSLSSGGQRQPVTALRVVDASVFWKIPGYFIVTNIYMASEKAADTILAAWGELSTQPTHI